MGIHGSGTIETWIWWEDTRDLCVSTADGELTPDPGSGPWTASGPRTFLLLRDSRLHNTVLARHGGRVDLELSLDGMWTERMFQPLLQTETCMLLHTRRAFETWA